jgi:dynein heavy chain, axonemal
MPLAGTIESYLAHTSKFPAVDHPEVCGIHTNASFALGNKEGESLLAHILDFAFAGPSGSLKDALADHDLVPGGNHQGAMLLKSKLQDVEAKLPGNISSASLLTLSARSSTVGMISFVYQEAQKYNTLVQALEGRVWALQQHLRGELVMEEEARQELEGIICDKTPVRWLVHSYPASQSLSGFLRNLKERVGYIKSLIEHLLRSQEAPTVEKFWLPGFFSPQSLFALFLQLEARRLELPLEKTTFRFAVTSLHDDGSDSPHRAQE